MRSTLLRPLLCLGCLLVACSKDDGSSDQGTSPVDASTETLTDDDAADDDTAGDDVADDDAPDDDTADDDAADDDTADDDTADNDAADDDAADDDTAVPATDDDLPVVEGGDPMVDCHDLDYVITCDVPEANAGYFACSDYFGDTTGVEAQCSAGADVDVRRGPPCGSYEFPVGTCVYFAEELSDRCYATHVGAETAEQVEAGQAFWSIACAGEWLPAR